MNLANGLKIRNKANTDWLSVLAIDNSGTEAVANLSNIGMLTTNNITVSGTTTISTLFSGFSGTKEFSVGLSGTINERVNIVFPKQAFGGSVEIELFGYYNGAYGTIKKIFNLGLVADGTIQTSTHNVVYAGNEISQIVAIGELTYDGTNFIIPIANLVVGTNSFHLRIRATKASSAFNVITFISAITLSSVITGLPALSANEVSFSRGVSVGGLSVNNGIVNRPSGVSLKLKYANTYDDLTIDTNGNCILRGSVTSTSSSSNDFAGNLSTQKTLYTTRPTAGVGTVALDATTAIVGTGTDFISRFKVGDTITVQGETVRTIDSISSNTAMTVSVAYATTASGLTYTTITINGFIASPNGAVFCYSLGLSGSATITGSTTTKSITLLGASEETEIHFNAGANGGGRYSVGTGSSGLGLTNYYLYDVANEKTLEITEANTGNKTFTGNLTVNGTDSSTFSGNIVTSGTYYPTSATVNKLQYVLAKGGSDENFRLTVRNGSGILVDTEQAWMGMEYGGSGKLAGFSFIRNTDATAYVKIQAGTGVDAVTVNTIGVSIVNNLSVGGIISGSLEKVYCECTQSYSQVIANATHVVVNYNSITTDTHNGVAGTGGSVVNATTCVVGKWYQIWAVGTTNFTLIGASANTVGVYFKATGVGTGTGTVMELWSWTCPVGHSGLYFISPSVTVASATWSTACLFEMNVIVNGAYNGVFYDKVDASHTAYFRMAGGEPFNLVEGDVVQVAVRQTQGSSQSLVSGSAWGRIKITKSR